MPRFFMAGTNLKGGMAIIRGPATPSMCACCACVRARI